MVGSCHCWSRRKNPGDMTFMYGNMRHMGGTPSIKQSDKKRTIKAEISDFSPTAIVRKRYSLYAFTLYLPARI